VRRRSDPRPSKDILAALDLRPDERVLAWATGPQGEWILGSNLALHVPEPGGGHRRIGWEEMERADWQRDTDRLAVVEVSDWGRPERTTVLQVDEPGHLLELLRERVTKSVVYRMYAPVRRSAGLSVVGRRSPTGHGPVSWSYVLSPGLDPRDPAVVHVAEAALSRAQRELDGL
jgi:hypothetical protein